MLQPKHTGSFAKNFFQIDLIIESTLGNIWNNSGVKEIVGRNPSVPKSEELRPAILDRFL